MTKSASIMTGDGRVTTEKAKIQLEDGKGMSLVYGIPSPPPSDPICLVFGHGAGGPMYSPFITYFHTELAKRGFLTLKFNFPYMEARRKVPDRREVLEASYRKVVEHARTSGHDVSHLFIGGKSMGGRIASQVAANGLDVDGLFFLGYPLHPSGKPNQLRDEHLYRIQKPMLFISGTKDNFATKELLEKTLSRIGKTARVHWIQHGDHSLNTGGGKEVLARTYEEVCEVLTDWVRDCLSSIEG